MNHALSLPPLLPPTALRTAAAAATAGVAAAAAVAPAPLLLPLRGGLPPVGERGGSGGNMASKGGRSACAAGSNRSIASTASRNRRFKVHANFADDKEEDSSGGGVAWKKNIAL